MRSDSKTFGAAALAVAAVLLGSQAVAQTPSIYPDPLLSAPPTGGYQMATADFNGDGRTDLVVADDRLSGKNQGGVWVYLASASAGYAPPVFLATAAKPYAVATGDVNGDGSPDIVTGNQYGGTANHFSVLINDGDGTFQPYEDHSVSLPSPLAVTVADATGDGRADILVVGKGRGVFLFPGQGDGTFDASTEQTLTTSDTDNMGIAVGDLNADGRPDIVAAVGCSGGGAVDVFMGRPGGTFASTPERTVTGVGACPTVALADFNGDGLSDVAVASSADGAVQVLLNEGGLLTRTGKIYPLPSHSDQPARVHTADLDGDGRVDLIVSDYDSDAATVLFGNGDGSFSAPLTVPMGSAVRDVAAVGIPAHRSLNLVALVGNGSVSTARNRGNRSFRAYADYPYQPADGAGEDASDMVSADLNGDGRPDLAVADGTDAALSVMLNDGHGGFGPPALLGLPGHGDAGAVATADVNGDRRPDLVAADDHGHLYSFLGQADGSFQAPRMSVISVNPVKGLALGDLDRDGRVDALVSLPKADEVQVCRGDGAGHFDCGSYAALLVVMPNRVRLADVNGDGKLDLIAASEETDLSVPDTGYAFVYLGDGAGGFATPPKATLRVPGGAFGIAAGDVNGDGHPDLVFGSYGNSISVLTGDGKGDFAAAAAYPSGAVSPAKPYFVALADVNGDGRPDIVAANSAGPSLSLFLNQGGGRFGAPVNHAAGDGVFPVLAVDVDGDGLPDVVGADNHPPGHRRQGIEVFLHDHRPAVRTERIIVAENQTVSGAVVTSDPGRRPLTFAVATRPAHGTVTLNSSQGTFIYRPNQGYTGDDRFSVTATDGLEQSAPGAVSVAVRGDPGGTGSGGGTLGWPSLVLLAALWELRRRR